MKNKTLSGLFWVAALGIASVPASAGVVLYTDQASWLTAVSGSTTNPVDLSNAQSAFAPSFTSGGVTFTGNGAPPQYNNVPYIFGSSTTSPLFGDQYFLYGNGLVNGAIQASSNIYAIGFFVGCQNNCGYYQQVLSAASSTTSLTTLFSTVTGVGVPANYPVYYGQDALWSSSAVQFFGLVSTSPLTQISITSNDVVPNISIGNIVTAGQGTTPGGDTPEAATLVLIGTGLGLIFRYRRYACLPTALS